jgi:general nucleoside transport system ATP-binding protein
VQRQIPRLELIDICKTYPSVVANDHINLKVMAGEIHALLGENGAGKSTLVKIIYGIVKPDSGTILWNDKEVSIDNPRHARQCGIGMVFQHFSLFDALTVYENIALGFDDHISKTELSARINDVMARYNFNLQQDQIVAHLSVGQRQKIEILRALLLNPTLLIMDEPTSVLTPQEVGHLFTTLRQIAAEGCSILYISHKLNEIVELCESATILRNGKMITTCDPRNESPRSMAHMMIGNELRDATRHAHSASGDVICALNHISLNKADTFSIYLDDINLQLKKGEILGIAGVAGNGQKELYDVLSGEVAASTGHMTYRNRDITKLDVNGRRQLGMSAIPEERNGHGAVSEFSLIDNTLLTARHKGAMTAHHCIRYDHATQFTADVISTYKVKGSVDHLAGALSGGNLQKFIVGREISQKPDVLIVCQPTWGVDAGAASLIHKELFGLVEQGSSIIVISQDLDELVQISDRIAVIHNGTLSDAYPTGTLTIEHIGLLMAGVHEPHQSTAIAAEIEV